MGKKKSKAKTEEVDEDLRSGPGRQTTWKGAKLHFLKERMEQFLACAGSDRGNFYRETAVKFFEEFGYVDTYQNAPDPQVPVERPQPLDEIPDENARQVEGARRANLVDTLRPVSVESVMDSGLNHTFLYHRSSGTGFVTTQRAAPPDR